MAEQSENYKKGTEIRRKLMGDAYADKMAKSVYDDPIMQKFGDYAREAVFGMLWQRPGLDLKTKTLICVISDTAQARWPELAIHLRFARNTGWTEDELSEALMHLCGYIGLPSVREAMLTAKEGFHEMKDEKAERLTPACCAGGTSSRGRWIRRGAPGHASRFAPRCWAPAPRSRRWS